MALFSVIFASSSITELSWLTVWIYLHCINFNMTWQTWREWGEEESKKEHQAPGMNCLCEKHTGHWVCACSEQQAEVARYLRTQKQTHKMSRKWSPVSFPHTSLKVGLGKLTHIAWIKSLFQVAVSLKTPNSNSSNPGYNLICISSIISLGHYFGRIKGLFQAELIYSTSWNTQKPRPRGWRILERGPRALLSQIYFY